MQPSIDNHDQSIGSAIFSQSSSLSHHLLTVIFSPSEITRYDILTIPSGVSS
ncbi:hypothetical protein [Providencia sneebia]|uniref:hypothetical protein n=1 Tax=Providencia sneebia TaxID=516075 RepID=UPI0012EA57A6|nr:hypothetical protein [Providencia sneebia]